jgi:epoxyqueuosine reductase QueG
MDKTEFIEACLTLMRDTPGNVVDIPDIGETVLYEEPLIGFASADDEIFETYRRKEVIGRNFMGPSEWLEGAATVVSFFLPFSEAVRVSNRKDSTDPSKEWLYARIEGQEFIGKYMEAVKKFCEDQGMRACVPSADERFGVKIEITAKGLRPDFHADSRWSERHAAYACGLGTFGLSRGLITEKGMAGRFASIIITEELEPAVRPYTGIDDYCIRCGACVRNCPANAISLEHGKNNIKCNQHVEKMKAKYAPRYGCGKCQVGVPCEFRNPSRKG